MVRAVPGSPAPQAGLRGIDQTGALGDVIVSVIGQPARRLSDLTEQLEAVGVGREIELAVKRNDRPITVRTALPVEKHPDNVACCNATRSQNRRRLVATVLGLPPF
jgi:S1-C subfamily serine protease